jgi:hypothetical protein
LRSLIRRIILSRPVPATVELKVVWVSGAVSLLTVPASLHRSGDLPDYQALIDRVLALGTDGYQDAAIARRLTAEGFRSARRLDVSAKLVEKVRRDHGVGSLTERCRRQDTMDGWWTTGGLARPLGVSAEWLRQRIANDGVPAQRHPATGR